MSRRSPETLADYLVVAICPALIMLLVGSLMWFLVEVFYQGEFKSRLLWVMAMFVLGIVCIARSSMERGMTYAPLLGVALAGAVAVALVQLVKDGIFIGGPLMLLVWWAAHKLTWDCTVMDDERDVSGQGLLQQMGLDPSAASAANSPPGTTARVGEQEGTSTIAGPVQAPWWETLLEPDRRPHAPGVWVVYFSLAALPLFGIGGWFVTDSVARAGVFGLLVIYVACGMGLLLATSFLGLRRYLRQRKLEMPVEMTTTWIVVGVVMIVATLLVAAILPRPSREHSLSQLPFAVTSAVRRASCFAMGTEGTKDDAAKNAARGEAKEDQSTERQGSSGKSDAQQSSTDSASNQNKSGDGGSSGGENGKGKSGDKSGKSPTSGGGEKGEKSESKSRSGEANSEKQNKEQKAEERENQSPSNDQPPPSQSPAGSPISSMTSLLSKLLGLGIKWLFYAGLAVGGVVAAWIYREELAAGWQKLLEELRELWEKWFGGKKAAETVVDSAPVAPPPRTFASYSDPFMSGDARGMSWPQLVRYTFEALEAWGREHACPRPAGQTPHEFALAVGVLEPQIAAGVQSLAASYSQLAYAPRATAPASTEPLRQLWTAMRARQTTLQAV